MIVSRVRVQSRVPGFEKKSLMIIGFETDNLGHRMNFENVEVVSLLWTRTLGTIISYFRKSTKASRKHELHGRAR